MARVNKNFKLAICKTLTQNEIKAKLEYYEKCVFIMDILSVLFNVIVLIWTYLNHFTYNKQGYRLTTKDNIQRLICLGLSFVVIIFLIIRMFLNKQIQVYQYLLHLRASSNALL